jgi:hypothetical protein
MRTSVLRILSGLVGILLLTGTSLEAYFQSVGFYREHYVWPIEKYASATPLRWQDGVFLAIFWSLAIGLFYSSYRLLRYAFRRVPPVTS